MSNFVCEHCGTTCYDTPDGYITGCEHYPADITASQRGMNEHPMVQIVAGGCRWFENGTPKEMDCASCYGHGVCEHEHMAEFLALQHNVKAEARRTGAE